MCILCAYLHACYGKLLMFSWCLISALGNKGIFIFSSVTAFASSATSLKAFQSSRGEQSELKWKLPLAMIKIILNCSLTPTASSTNHIAECSVERNSQPDLDHKIKKQVYRTS